MMKLNPGNILLKPSHRRQILTWLRRALQIGNHFKNFVLDISMFRTGRQCEVTATVKGVGGEIVCKTRRKDWQDAARDLARELSIRLRDQRRLRLA